MCSSLHRECSRRYITRLGVRGWTTSPELDLNLGAERPGNTARLRPPASGTITAPRQQKMAATYSNLAPPLIRSGEMEPTLAMAPARATGVGTAPVKAPETDQGKVRGMYSAEVAVRVPARVTGPESATARGLVPAQVPGPAPVSGPARGLGWARVPGGGRSPPRRWGHRMRSLLRATAVPLRH